LVKNACRAGVVSLLLYSCVTVAPPPPNLYLETLPQSLVTPLTLEERIQMQEAWDALRQGRLQKAEKAFLRLGPDSPLYAVGLGYLSLIGDDYASAEGWLGQEIERNPNSLLGQLGLVQLFRKTGEEDKEFNALREVLKIDPANLWAKEGYESLKSRKTEQAVTAAREAAARGEIQSAREAYLMALHYSPEAVAIHLAIADLYKSEGKVSNAIVHLKAAAAGAPEKAEVLQLYAAALAEDKQYDRSLDVYQKVLELDPKNEAARRQVEDIKNRLGIVELPSRYSEIASTAALTREDVAALLAVKLKDVLGETSSPPPIIIDISASWASKFILKVTSLGLLEVHSNHAFQPKRTVTKAEFAETLVRVIRYLEGRGTKFIRQIPLDRIKVQDVSPDHFYYQPISQILSYQVMELDADRAFRPDQPVPGPEAVKTVDILLALAR
jgi:tetratricopeptide (TPR) repeat protein